MYMYTERESAGLLRGNRSSVVRASTAKVGGLGLNSQWLPRHFDYTAAVGNQSCTVYSTYW